MRTIALTRPVSPTLADCELTHLAREPINVTRAAAEHAAYERALAGLDVRVQRLPAAPSLPDAVFVEDTAVVLDEIAVITRPGASSRQPETAVVAEALAVHRPLAQIQAPATLDGGDVLVIHRTVFVGLSSRTSRLAVDQLRDLLEPWGYRVVPVSFGGCLHLKTAVTLVGEELLLANPAWVDPGTFPGCRVLSVDPGEPYAANALCLGGAIIFPGHFPRTRARLEAEGLRIIAVELEELAKAEAGVTCCSLILRSDPIARRIA